jgi:hypothetical protein
VWWLKPFVLALEAPGLRRLARRGYRWLARNRHCLGGQCVLPTRRGTHKHRHVSFLDLP